VLDDAVFGARDLHSLHRAEDLAERTGDAAGRDLAGGTRLLESPRRDLRHRDDRDQRHEHEDGDRRIHVDEDRHRGDREHREAEHVDGPVGAVLSVLDVVAEHAQRLAG
jgi:hypothetical protein